MHFGECVKRQNTVCLSLVCQHFAIVLTTICRIHMQSDKVRILGTLSFMAHFTFVAGFSLTCMWCGTYDILAFYILLLFFCFSAFSLFKFLCCFREHIQKIIAVLRKLPTLFTFNEYLTCDVLYSCCIVDKRHHCSPAYLVNSLKPTSVAKNSCL